MASIQQVDSSTLESIRELDKLGFLADFEEGPNGSEVSLYSFHATSGGDPLHKFKGATTAEAFATAIAFAKEQA